VGREQRSRLVRTVEQLGTQADQMAKLTTQVEGLANQLIQVENLVKDQAALIQSLGDLIASFRNFPRIFVGSVELEAAFGKKRMGTISLNAFDPE
jgi:hypothetical protein